MSEPAPAAVVGSSGRGRASAPPPVGPPAPVLDAAFSPGPGCRPFEPHPFQMHLCPPGDGLRARWTGRRWVTDPAGRDVLVLVSLLRVLTGAAYLTIARAERGAAPVVVRLSATAPDWEGLAIGPADLLGTGDRVCLTVAPAG